MNCPVGFFDLFYSLKLNKVEKVNFRYLGELEKVNFLRLTKVANVNPAKLAFNLEDCHNQGDACEPSRRMRAES